MDAQFGSNPVLIQAQIIEKKRERPRIFGMAAPKAGEVGLLTSYLAAAAIVPYSPMQRIYCTPATADKGGETKPPPNLTAGRICGTP